MLQIQGETSSRYRKVVKLQLECPEQSSSAGEREVQEFFSRLCHRVEAQEDAVRPSETLAQRAELLESFASQSAVEPFRSFQRKLGWT
jgi:hypothetical protein